MSEKKSPSDSPEGKSSQTNGNTGNSEQSSSGGPKININFVDELTKKLEGVKLSSKIKPSSERSSSSPAQNNCELHNFIGNNENGEENNPRRVVEVEQLPSITVIEQRLMNHLETMELLQSLDAEGGEEDMFFRVSLELYEFGKYRKTLRHSVEERKNEMEISKEFLKIRRGFYRNNSDDERLELCGTLLNMMLSLLMIEENEMLINDVLYLEEKSRAMSPEEYAILESEFILQLFGF